MVQMVIRLRDAPTRRMFLIWRAFVWLVAAFDAVYSTGYVALGNRATQSATLVEVATVERNLHVHGLIMLLISGLLVYGLSNYRYVMPVALGLSFAYPCWVALLIFGGWTRVGVSWGAPWWYLFLAGVSFVLIIFAPRAAVTGRRRGLEGRGSA